MYKYYCLERAKKDFVRNKFNVMNQKYSNNQVNLF